MTLAKASELRGHPPAKRRMERPFRHIWAFFGDRAKRVLLDFANVKVSTNDVGHYLPGSNDWEYFREKWGLFLRGEDDQKLFELVTELQFHWRQGALPYYANRLLWREERPWPSGEIKWMEFTDHAGAVSRIPVPFSLKRTLAFAILDLAPLLGYCENPDCLAPYFLKGRITQQFCGLPNCTAYGQRQHKLNWWKEHGSQWRKRRQVKPRKRKVR